MEKPENQFTGQTEIFVLGKTIVIGLVLVAMILLALFSFWTSSSMPREEAIWGSVFLVAIGIIGLAIFSCIYFLKVRAKKGLLNLEKELGGDQCH